MLTDERWLKLSGLMYSSGRVYNKPEYRMTPEGILYRMRTGCPWQDLPREFGQWSSVFRRFNLWSKKGILETLFKALSSCTDMEWLFIDGSIVKAHQHSAGAASTKNEALGKSRGGHSTKTHLAVSSYGLPVNVELSGRQVNDVVHADSLIADSPASDYVIADKGYDSQALRNEVECHGAKPVIPRRKHSRADNRDMDWCLYRYRHLVENAFARIKHFRAIATRYDKLERNYYSMLMLVFSMMWLPMWVD